MKYKLIASDFDNTFLSTTDTVSARQLEAVRKFSELGGKFFLCSGRLFASIREEAKRFGIHGDVICYDGAMVANIDTGEIKYHDSMSVDVAVSLIKLLEEEGHIIHVYIDDKLYISEKSEYTDFYCNACKIGHTEVGKLSEFVQSQGKSVTQILVVGTAETISDLNARLSAIPNSGFVTLPSADYLLDIVSSTASKGNTLKKVCEMHGVKREECVAFGDSPNDISMLRYAGLGVAVGNARDEVKQAADYVCERCDDDGVGKVIEKIIKGEDLL